jgi:hypothetical protein
MADPGVTKGPLSRQGIIAQLLLRKWTCRAAETTALLSVALSVFQKVDLHIQGISAGEP